MLCTMNATDRKILEAMIEQMNQSTARADAALDRALAFVAESEKRIAVLGRKREQLLARDELAYSGARDR